MTWGGQPWASAPWAAAPPATGPQEITGAGAIATAETFGSSRVLRLADFTITAVGGGAIPAQQQGVSFNVEITARDHTGATHVGFTGTVDVQVPGATVTQGAGQSAAFTAGVLVHALTITSLGNYFVHVGEWVLLIAEGDSNSFDVLAIEVLPSAIATAEAFGTALIDQPQVNPTGIAPAETFGTLALDLTLNPAGIASAQAFGVLVVDRPHVDPTGIASAQAFGTLALDLTLNPTGIAPAEAFGTLALDLTLNPAGIASAQAFGTTEVVGVVELSNAGAIASAEAHGTAFIELAINVSPVGIASAQAFGTLTIILHVNAAGIASAETFGIAFVELPIRVDPAGIASAQEFGAAIIEQVTSQFVDVLSIATGELLGTLTIVLTVDPSGVPSAFAAGALELVPAPPAPMSNNPGATSVLGSSGRTSTTGPRDAGRTSVEGSRGITTVSED